jgi:Ca2+-binding EF-hand superfamily protein
MSRTAGLVLASMLSVCTAAAAQPSRAAMRFAAMDRNGDGRISRQEWNGSDRSFQVHDWNGDGVLSGDEVRPGARRQRGSADREPVFDSAYREYEYDDWTLRGFTALDHNRDGRITSDEWHFDRESFRRADHNGDGVLTRAEFLDEDAQDDDIEDRIAFMDSNHDGRVTRSEWHGSPEAFDRLDGNRDGVLSGTEMNGSEPPPDLFSSVDVNRDSRITRDEWHWSRASFDQRDRNRDGQLTRDEFAQGAEGQGQGRSRAYQAGYERGRVEGLQAGREDRERNQGWDLEGQRELESADSGYAASLGPRADYQAGYREAFRSAYREGFGR